MTDVADARSAGPHAQYDTDGVLRGQVVLDGLVKLLDLEKIEDNIYRGHSPPGDPRARVFGGQVASQALIAAGRTVDPPVRCIRCTPTSCGRVI